MIIIEEIPTARTKAHLGLQYWTSGTNLYGLSKLNTQKIYHMMLLSMSYIEKWFQPIQRAV